MGSKLRIRLLGNDPADRQWSMLEYGSQLRSALAPLVEAAGFKLEAVSPDSRSQTAWLRKLPLGKTAAMYASRCLIYPRLLSRTQPADLEHILDHGNSRLIRRLNPERTVITCHDLVPLVLKERLRSVWPRFSEAAYRDAVSGLPQAAAVLADSASTRQDLMRLLGGRPERIHVVPLGLQPGLQPPAGPAARAAARRAFDFPEDPLLLHVGQSAGYKNIEGILRCLRVLADRKRPARLVRAGAPFSRSQKQLIVQLGIGERITDLGPLPRPLLLQLYHATDLLLFPSWYEGFGLPPLEAMASGLPVIASDRGSLAEVLGEAARIVPPDRPEAMAEAVEQLLETPALREEMTRKGVIQAARFNWKESAAKTWAVYQTLLS
ncbi:MAG: hypothetical protein COV76_02150 [Candidatus Omnitrophica bacterium CG11_big_fil_rev_8_21_14_0_20_64_10]|nr:MAG: hypothetical protein COV76_02150 [Candidatus Omnitrophica bacterium CG11_big_fil_rev_8_21_14_0_20_64_10]